jgi:hypothetical protein
MKGSEDQLASLPNHRVSVIKVRDEDAFMTLAIRSMIVDIG